MGLLKDVETFLIPADILADEGIPSLSIAWQDHPAASLQSHTIAKGRENTETVYQACSISKAITALAVAKLVDEGRLSYETRVVDYIPQSILDIIGSEHLMQRVTVGRLLSHTSGLSQHGFPGYSGDVLPTYEEIFAGRPPANTPRVRVSSFPGSQMSYSGGGFTLLQVFLEKFTGVAFAEFMRQTVLEPLEMTRSIYGDLPPEEKNYARAHFTAYTPGTTPSTAHGYHRFTELAAAGLWTTPTDLLKATSAIQTSLYPSPSSPQTFLSPYIARVMLTRAYPLSPESSRKLAMGWFTDSTFFAHAGDNEPGYNCYLIASHSNSPILPGDPTNRSAAGLLTSHPPSLFSLAIMTNSALGFPVIKKLINALFAMKSFPLYPDLPCGISSMTDYIPFPAPEGIVHIPGWDQWIGHWEDGWEIYDDEGMPMVVWDGLEVPHRLIHTATPNPVVEGVLGFFFKIEGIEMGIRMVPGPAGQKWIEVVGKSVNVLERSNSRGSLRALLQDRWN